MTPYAVELLTRVEAAYRDHADPARATAMTAYMRGQFTFLGLGTPARRALDRLAVAGLPRPTQDDLAAVAAGCWQMPEREFQHFAVDHLRRHVRSLGPGFIGQVERLIVDKPWWDTVDGLATQVVGPLVAAEPAVVQSMDAWIEADNLWVVRAAILHQLLWRDRTDTARLWRYCERRSTHPDFFVRKAIGWALREYSKTDGAAVVRFVAAHTDTLAPLSQREALKWLGRREP
jgi:3-methyladenine DNA glycosylase AlkD